jgi:site-specific DNA recombinase
VVTNNNIIKNVAVYLRISRDKGENVDTLQNHRERLERLCEERGYTYTIYEEIVSGQARMEAREALNSLLDDLEKYDAVVVTAIDRLSRDLEYSIHIFKRLEKAGIPVITPERIYTNKTLPYTLLNQPWHMENISKLERGCFKVKEIKP